MSRSTVLAVTLVTVSASVPHVVVRTECPAPLVARAEPAAVVPFAARPEARPGAAAPPAPRPAPPAGGLAERAAARAP